MGPRGGLGLLHVDILELDIQLGAKILFQAQGKLLRGVSAVSETASMGVLIRGKVSSGGERAGSHHVMLCSLRIRSTKMRDVTVAEMPSYRQGWAKIKPCAVGGLPQL